MKKLLYLAAMLLIAATSCNSTNIYRETLEKETKAMIKNVATYKFVSCELTNTETLKDEVENRQKYFSDVLVRDIDILENARKYHNQFPCDYTEENVTIALESYRKDSTIVALLNSIEIDYPEIYDQPSSHEYTLTFEMKNDLGMSINGRVVGRFNTQGELVAIKLDNGSWETRGNFFSIPGFNELILKKNSFDKPCVRN